MNGLSAWGGVGIYGVTEPLSKDDFDERLGGPGIDKVFVPPRPEMVAYFSSRGLEVFLTLSAFGGQAGSGEYTDAIPVTADGTKLAARFNGICPTHSAWRQSRLDLLDKWLGQFAGKQGISGIWLDFIRYPGHWESPVPEIPDTCYCDRCLTIFQAEKKIALPDSLGGTAEKAAWIAAHVPLQWMEWKKEQITSFVRDARKVLDGHSGERRLKLGVFLVPWRKSDFGGALSFGLAQDAVQFEDYVDVYSPMTYHRMVGRPVDWVGEIGAYYADMVGGQVWPIIQAEQVADQEFGAVVDVVSASGSTGLLVYSYKSIESGHWPHLTGFEAAVNLVPNPAFELTEEPVPAASMKEVGVVPLDWEAGAGGEVRDSRFMVTPPDDSGTRTIGIAGGVDRQGRWSTTLPDCTPGERYRFTADFFRHDLADRAAYPEITVWGRSFLLNTHRMFGTFQNLSADVLCPEISGEREQEFSFVNTHPGTTFWMTRPRLVKRPRRHIRLQIPPDDRFFPVGAYGATVDNVEQIRESGLNSALVPLDEKSIDACLAARLHCMVNLPRDPERLIVQLEKVQAVPERNRLSFYVNDEPGIHSFPVWKAADIQRLVKQRFPNNYTAMAIVRPQVISDYQEGADYFMLDQYPVPSMPMTWLSDSLDEAAGQVGKRRLQAVVQAFGGPDYAPSGWPRLPSFEEMNCLAFLAVIHGARGLYFYTYPVITSSPQGTEAFAKVVSRLNSMRSWLERDNDPEPIDLNMTSENRFDPQGRPAVHCTAKTQYDTRMLLCANTIATSVEAEITAPPGTGAEWQEYFSGSGHGAVDGAILARFAPFEVKVLLETK